MASDTSSSAKSVRDLFSPRIALGVRVKQKPPHYAPLAHLEAEAQWPGDAEVKARELRRRLRTEYGREDRRPGDHDATELIAFPSQTTRFNPTLEIEPHERSRHAGFRRRA